MGKQLEVLAAAYDGFVDSRSISQEAWQGLTQEVLVALRDNEERVRVLSEALRDSAGTLERIYTVQANRATYVNLDAAFSDIENISYCGKNRARQALGDKP